MPRTKTSSKRQRGDEAGPSRRPRIDEVLMKATFINDRAEALYHSSIVKKKCIPERGIDLLGTDIMEQIQEREWEAFVATPEAAVVPVVREFYANAKEQFAMDRSTLKSLVRGKWVHYDRRTINTFYGLTEEGDDEYMMWLDEEPDTDEVLNSLAIPGGQWHITDGQIRTLSKRYMTVETKAWHYFICGKLVPSNHYSDATKDRALLNFAIQTGRSINVGRVIEQSIISHLTGRVTVGLGHPSLIYQLCLRAGVVSSPAEEVHHPGPTITNKMIQNLERQTPRAVPVEATTEGEAGTSSAPQPTRRGRKSTAPTPPPPTRAEFERLEQKLKEIQREQRTQNARQTARLDRIFEDHRQQFEYVKESMQILAAMIQGGPSTTMPSPPQFPVYPPPTPSDSSEEEEEEEEDASDA